MHGFFSHSRSIKKRDVPLASLLLCPKYLLAVGYGWVDGRMEHLVSQEKNTSLLTPKGDSR